MKTNLFGIISVYFEVTGQLLIIYYAFGKYLSKKWDCTWAVLHLHVCINFNKTYDLDRIV